MPAPLAAPAIAAAASALSTGAQVYAAGRMNKKTRQWNESMYGMQRQHALDDWNRQNDYNHPLQQMQRLKEAGLNPNLVYGKGADNTAQPIKNADVKSWSPETPNYSGFGNSITSYYDVALQQEQVKNIKAQRENMEMDTLLKTLDQTSKSIRNDKDLFDLNLSKELRDTTIQKVIEGVRGLKVGTDISLSQEARDAAMHAPNLEKAILGIADISAGTKLKFQDLKNKHTQNLLDQAELVLRKNGISYGDPMIARIIANAINQPIDKIIQEVIKGAKGQSNKPLGIGVQGTLKAISPEGMWKIYQKSRNK